MVVSLAAASEGDFIEINWRVLPKNIFGTASASVGHINLYIDDECLVHCSHNLPLELSRLEHVEIRETRRIGDQYFVIPECQHSATSQKSLLVILVTEPATSLPYRGSMKTILLVDDHALVRKGIRGAVNGHYTICGEASNGLEAVEKTLSLKPDWVILDVTMPVMNGIEAARQIRTVSPQTKIVFLSMHQGATFKTQLNAIGADAFLPKTVAPDHLIAVIQGLLTTHSDLG